MTKERIFVVVIGQDQKGIIAQVSGLLFKHKANIEDVQQKVMDGTFVMTLLADITDSPEGAMPLRRDLEELGQNLGLKVMLHHEDVVNAMHRI